MRRAVLVAIVAFLLAQACREGRAAETSEELAAEAVREYDVLAQSLEPAARALVTEAEELAAKMPEEPAIVWSTTKRKPELFLSPEGELGELKTERAYSISATKRAYRYRFLAIDRIARTGHREFPFEATARFEVSFIDRVARLSRTEPLPVPKSFRKPPKEKPKDGQFKPREVYAFLEVAEEQPCFWGTFGPHPLPTGPPERCIPEDHPKTVKEARKDLLGALAKAKPSTHKAVYEVVFRYSATEHKWQAQRGRQVKSKKEPRDLEDLLDE